MNKRTAPVILTIAVGAIYFAFKNSHYLDRKFHAITAIPGPSIKANLMVNTLYVDHDEVIFEPPITITETIGEDSTSAIRIIGGTNEDTFGTNMAYHRSLVNTSNPGSNPKWEKRMIVEIMFYKKDEAGNWKWSVSSTHVIDNLKGTDEPMVNSITWQDYETKKEFGIAYDLGVK